METVRCGQCNKLLAVGEYTRLQIKCGRCRTLNDLRAPSPTPERQRASSTTGDRHDASERRKEPPGLAGGKEEVGRRDHPAHAG
ncbi:Com family DNA-binding transcriptional regulator [Aquabacterium sp.]|uniref:Com family DNA-binding transcriptional regulator n=1 Tax=Aquabacterium sp. TaxID=1872578 RepID=UPI0035C73D32